MKLPLTGGCLCGKVRYKISAAPVGTAICHCRTCQKAVGAPHFAALFVPADSLQITGEFTEYASIADSGNTMYRSFCPACGTSLFGRNSKFTEVRPVSAVTLDDPSDYKPEKDMWVSSAQPWDVMNPELAKFAGNPWK